MKVSKIEITGYKSLKHVVMSGVGNLVIIIGENSSGKTNLLEALQILFASFESDFDENVDEPELLSSLWHRKNTSSRIKYDLDFEFTEEELRLILGNILFESISKKNRSDISNIRIHKELDFKKGWIKKSLSLGKVQIIDDDTLVSFKDIISDLAMKILFKLTKVDILLNNLVTDSMYILYRKSDDFGYIMSFDEVKPFVDGGAIKLHEAQTEDINIWLSENDIPSLKPPEDRKSLGIPSLKNIVSRIMAILFTSYRMITPASSSSDQRLLLESDLLDETRRIALSGEYEDEEEWNKIRADFESVYRGRLTTKREELLVEEEGRSYPVDSMGSGHQSWLRLLREIRRWGKIVAIEEPEAHLHPSLCRHIFDYIKTISESTQIILTTHSPIFIDRIQKENNWVVEMTQGESHIYRFEDFTQALEAVGAKPSDRLMPESILLVEGESDKVFFEGCAKKLKLKTDNLLIVPVRGKSNTRRNLDAWVPVIQGTQIRLHILLDQDALCVVQNLVRRRVLDESDYTILEGELEDLYPRDLLVSGMEKLFKVTFETIDPISPPRKDYLRSKLLEANIDDGSWKFILAEYMADIIPKEKIPKAIRDLIENMKKTN